MREILAGAAVFDGERLLDDAVVVVEDGRILSVAPPDQDLAGIEGDRHDRGRVDRSGLFRL